MNDFRERGDLVLEIYNALTLKKVRITRYLEIIVVIILFW